MTIREQVIYKRKQNRISIAKLSRATGISASMLYKYEAHLVNLGEENLKKVLEYLNLQFILIDKELLNEQSVNKTTYTN